MAENQIISKIDQFNITDGLALLIGCYYVFFVNYPTPSAASGFLLFVQEMLLEIQEKNFKKTSKYNSLIDCLVKN